VALDGGQFGGPTRCDELIHLCVERLSDCRLRNRSVFRRTGFEMTDTGAQQQEMADRKPWYACHCEAACRGIEHPIRDLI
jgi:hypothetical protein